MGGDSEYEPRDSRNVTGEADTADGRWGKGRQPAGHGGEYEPRDSRNVTGTAATRDGRWTNRSGRPPLAAGGSEKPAPARPARKDRAPSVDFEPDPELSALIRRGPAP